ncbi:MAG TPA: YerC/YecD family TrpR-related protein [Candidatus Paceibacterota bacterium]
MDWKNPVNRRLVEAILSLGNEGEAERFLRDLLTENEIEEFARRFQTAELLLENVPYSEIERVSGLSSTTVARVSKWLKGEGGGYRLVISKLHHHSSDLGGRGLR